MGVWLEAVSSLGNVSSSGPVNLQWCLLPNADQGLVSW